MTTKAFKRVVVVLVFLAGRWVDTNAQTLTLYSFPGNGAGVYPRAGLVRGNDDNFYGTTYGGGTHSNRGTVFMITSSGEVEYLHSFDHDMDGGNPNGDLVKGTNGGFYGTTYDGGQYGYGTVYKITLNGDFTKLHDFEVFADGGSPTRSLVLANDSNFYGTALLGGKHGGGTVFRISPSGTFTTVHDFAYSEGTWPDGGVIQGADGNLYGTTYVSATNNYGSIYRLSLNGSFTNLHFFAGSSADGASPAGELVQGSDGNIYGTTSGGISNSGSVFRISFDGTFTNIHMFNGIDGYRPFCGLVQGSDGNFYGTTARGGAIGSGTIFRIGCTGTFTNLYSFSANRLVQGSDGNFYGTTVNGGAVDLGSVFKLFVPLNPPANQISAVQITGNDVALSIPSVAGETYQLQFSSSVDPTKWSNIEGASVTNSIGAMLTLTNFGGASSLQGFYRFTITP